MAFEPILHQHNRAPDPSFTDDRGVKFTPVWDPDDTGAVGFRCDGPNGTVYVYLNPSNADEDTPPSNVFLYTGPHGDPSNDAAHHWYDVEEVD